MDDVDDLSKPVLAPGETPSGGQSLPPRSPGLHSASVSTSVKSKAQVEELVPVDRCQLAYSGPNESLIGVNNGGRGLSQTSDDSHLNFKRGETFSKIFKGVHDLELKYRDSGLFLRGKYWYDFELKDEGRPIQGHRRQQPQAGRPGLRRRAARCLRLPALHPGRAARYRAPRSPGGQLG